MGRAVVPAASTEATEGQEIEAGGSGPVGQDSGLLAVAEGQRVSPMAIEVRTAAVADVRHRERVVDLVAVPYDEWTVVPHAGRLIEEQFAPGAFAHLGYRAHKFLVNLEHDTTRVVGRVLKLDPFRREGLRAEVKIRRGAEGDQVLLDAEDGLLDGSVAFGARPEDQRWEGRSRRRIVKAFLDHIALTFTPAYPGAKVLAVRAVAGSGTPNLDRVRLERFVVSASTPNLDRVLAGR